MRLLQSPETPFVLALCVVSESWAPVLSKNHKEKEKDVVVAKYFPAPTANQASLTEQLQQIPGRARVRLC